MSPTSSEGDFTEVFRELDEAPSLTISITDFGQPTAATTPDSPPPSSPPPGTPPTLPATHLHPRQQQHLHLHQCQTISPSIVTVFCAVTVFSGVMISDITTVLTVI